MGNLSEYEKTTGCIHSLGYHIVWCPKYRKPVLTGTVRDDLKNILQQVADKHNWTIEEIEIMPDHVHLFVRTPPKASPSFVTNQFKGISSNILRTNYPHLKSRLPTLWSRSYFIATVGRVSEDTIRKYIQDQTTKPAKKKK
jgi:putative transposase